MFLFARFYLFLIHYSEQTLYNKLYKVELVRTIDYKMQSDINQIGK